MPVKELLPIIKVWGTFVVPHCVVEDLEFSCMGFSCYGDSTNIHRVRDPACHLLSLDEEGEYGVTTCNERWVMDLATCWPDLDTSSE